MIRYNQDKGGNKMISYDELEQMALNKLDDDDLFVEVCDELDNYNGFLGDDRCEDMEMIDEFFSKPSDVLSKIDFDDFNYNHDYFYFDGYGNMCSTDYKAEYYRNLYNNDDVLDKYIEEWNHVSVSDSELEDMAQALDEHAEYYDEDTFEPLDLDED